MKIALFTLCILVQGALFSQTTCTVFLSGAVKTEDKKGERHLCDDCEIEITKDGILVSSFTTDSMGAFEAQLTSDAVWTLRVKKRRYYDKWILFDLNGIPEENKEGDFTMVTDFTMLKSKSRKTKRLLEKNPVGKCAYDVEEDRITWDDEYTSTINTQIKR